ncbi:hypothetical protein EDD18DRAFT_1051359, partial [Armillaria luteobubalina]
LGALPLVIGMPVMITQNFDVEGGIVNGSTGTLKCIRYRIDEAGRHIALSCIVHVPLMTRQNMTDMRSNKVAALQDTVDMDF